MKLNNALIELIIEQIELIIAQTLDNKKLTKLNFVTKFLKKLGEFIILPKDAIEATVLYFKVELERMRTKNREITHEKLLLEKEKRLIKLDAQKSKDKSNLDMQALKNENSLDKIFAKQASDEMKFELNLERAKNNRLKILSTLAKYGIKPEDQDGIMFLAILAKNGIKPEDPDGIILLDIIAKYGIKFEDPDRIKPEDSYRIIPENLYRMIPEDPDGIIPEDPDGIIPEDPDGIIPEDPDGIK